MQNRSLEKLGGFLIALWCAAVGVSLPVTAADQEDERLQQLLYGEALFHSHQQDYLTAITRLQLAEEQGLLPPASDDARLLLARLKLAYGLHVEAGFDFHALLGKDVPEPVSNRAWYELARTFSRKGSSTTSPRRARSPPRTTTAGFMRLSKPATAVPRCVAASRIT